MMHISLHLTLHENAHICTRSVSRVRMRRDYWKCRCFLFSRRFVCRNHIHVQASTDRLRQRPPVLLVGAKPFTGGAPGLQSCLMNNAGHHSGSHDAIFPSTRHEGVGLILDQSSYEQHYTNTIVNIIILALAASTRSPARRCVGENVTGSDKPDYLPGS